MVISKAKNKLEERFPRTFKWSRRIHKFINYSLLGLTFVGIVGGPKCYNYIDDKEDRINMIAVSGVNSITNNFISEKEKQDYIKKLNASKVDVGDALYSIYKGDFQGVKRLWHVYRNPESVQTQVSQLIIDANEKQKIWKIKQKNIDYALEQLSNDWSDRNISNYENALVELKSGFDTSFYEARFSELETKHEENLYFDDLSQNVLRLVSGLKEKNYDDNAIAVGVGLYFSEGISGVKFSEVSLLGRTRELSDEVTGQLDGYRINLESCLTTGQKR